MFRILLLAVGSLFTLHSFAQVPKAYWQQHINYDISVDFNVENHRYTGVEEIVYSNNSSDELSVVYFHLYYNAFQPGSMMDVRSRTIVDPDPRVGKRISELGPEEVGYLKIQHIYQSGEEISFKENGTILEVTLDKPLKPKEKLKLKLEFSAQVPIQIRRSGRDNKEGIDYSMSQWYPKMCEYDKDGWHAIPYIGREFHGVWGNFDVEISIDSAYTIGATGCLQNAAEIGHGYLKEGEKLGKKPKGSKLTWKFEAENVHDFVWAADPDYVHDIYKVDDDLSIHFFYQNDTLEDQWKALQPFTADAFRYANKRFGRYPYKVFSVIQGGDGGMEYPMATLIAGHGSQAALNSVTVHEFMHSWYQGVLATNESKYPWMDEGFTQFAQQEILSSMYNSQRNPHQRGYDRYLRIASSSKAEPLSTPADHFNLNAIYGSSSYYKGEVFLHQLSYIIGQDAFDKGMLNYFESWKFKHPTPDDFKRVMERVSSIELDWYFDYFIKSIKTIDYSIRVAYPNEEKTRIVIDRVGEMPMPVDLAIVMNDGTVSLFTIPLSSMLNAKEEALGESSFEVLSPWPWVYPSYEFDLDVSFGAISYILIDPSNRLADTNLRNNVFPSSTDIRYPGEKQ